MNSEYSVRLASPNDYSRIEQIVNESFPRFFRFFASHSLHEDGLVLVSEIPATITGFAKLIDFQLSDAKYGCILWLAVKPEFRRKGIARSLVKTGTEQLKKDGASLVFASVSRSNVASITVFCKEGFRKMSFLSLWRLFSWRVFRLFNDIWLAPGEIVLMHQ